MFTLTAVRSNMTPEDAKEFIKDTLLKYYGVPKSLAIAMMIVDMLEVKLPRPRSGYRMLVVADIRTGEVFLTAEKNNVLVAGETKVLIKHLHFGRRFPWSRYKLKVL